MNLRALIPRSNGGMLAPPDFAFSSLQREVDRLFEDFARAATAPSGGAVTALVPSMDVVETDKEIEITMELPGLERSDIEISIDDGTLTIRGEKKAEAERKDKNFHVSERSYGVFYRAIPLPQGVDVSSINATMAKGVLKITIPRPARPEPQKVEVKEAA
jgi:HSP20 family protein